MSFYTDTSVINPNSGPRQRPEWWEGGDYVIYPDGVLVNGIQFLWVFMPI